MLHQVKNAMLAGAKGIIMFSDPADYWAAGVQVQYFGSFFCEFVHYKNVHVWMVTAIVLVLV